MLNTHWRLVHYSQGQTASERTPIGGELHLQQDFRQGADHVQSAVLLARVAVGFCEDLVAEAHGLL